MQIVSEMEPLDAEVFVGVVVEGQTQAEAGARLGLTQREVSRIAHRARAQVAAELEERGLAPPS